MTRLIASLLFVRAVCFPAVTAITMQEVQQGVLTLSVSNTSADSIRVVFDVDSAFPDGFWRVGVSSGSTKHLVVGGGWTAGTTVFLQVQENAGGGFVDVACNGVGVTFDGVPEIGPTATCEAGGHISVPLPSDSGMTPSAPTNLPSGVIPNLCQGTVLTASSCADIQTDFDALKILTPDGDGECIEIPWDAEWRDCPMLNLRSGITNTDSIVLTSSRRGDNRCPADHETMLQGDVAECAPMLSKNGSGQILEIGGNVWLDRLHVTTPPPGHSSWGEGGEITSTVDSSGDLTLTVSSHNFIGSRPIVVTANPDSPASCPIMGLYQSTGFALNDANTITLTGEAGGVCPGGHAHQNPTFNGSFTMLIRMTESWVGGVTRSFIPTVYPGRFYAHFGWLSGLGDPPSGVSFTKSTIHFGTWGPYNASNTWQHYTGNSNHATTSILRANKMNRVLTEDIVQVGNGIGWFIDSYQNPTPTDWAAHAILHGFPKEWDVGEPEDASDGIVGIGISGRGHAYEFKGLLRGEFIGLAQHRVLKAPNNSNTPVDLLFFRNNAGPSGPSATDLGVSDIYGRSLVGHQTELLLGVEGWNTHHNLSTVRGRFHFENLLVNEPEEILELGGTTSAEHSAGPFLQLGVSLHKLRMNNFTRWKGNGDGSFIRGANVMGSYVEIEKGILAGETERNQKVDKMLFGNRQSNSSKMNPPTVNAEGDQAFYDSFNTLGLASSYVRDIVLAPGILSPGDSYDAPGITAATVNSQFASDPTYAVPDFKLYSGATVNAGINAIGCDADFDCGDDGGVDEAHDGDEGFVKDTFMADARQIWKHTGRSYAMEPERIDDNTIRFFFRAPDTSGTCTLRWRPVGSTDAFSTSTAATGSRDRSVDLTDPTHSLNEVRLKCPGPDELRTRARTGSAP